MENEAFIFRGKKLCSSAIHDRLLHVIQISNPKVTLFGPFSKIEPKIRKISQLQSAVEIALVDEFHRNLRQMKDLGLNLQEKFEKIFFDYVCIFYSTLNIGQIQIFGNVEKS